MVPATATAITARPIKRVRIGAAYHIADISRSRERGPSVPRQATSANLRSDPVRVGLASWKLGAAFHFRDDRVSGKIRGEANHLRRIDRGKTSTEVSFPVKGHDLTFRTERGLPLSLHPHGMVP